MKVLGFITGFILVGIVAGAVDEFIAEESDNG